MNESHKQGLLDLSVALSTRDITAGKDITIFVLIKNPFENQAWIRQVDVSLPNELRLSNKHQYVSLNKSKPNENKFDESKKIAEIQENLTKLKDALQTISDANKASDTLSDKIESFSVKVEDWIDYLNFKQKRNIYSRTNLSVEGGNLGNVRIYSNRANVSVAAEKEMTMGNIEIYDPELLEKEQSKSGRISLSGSLPEDKALQPGCTTVYTAVLVVDRPFLFTPSQYRLQFNVQYSFTRKPDRTKGEDESEDKLFSNTISQEISIRPSVSSMIIGGGFGGAVGSLSRVLQVNPAEEIQQFESSDYYASGISVVLAVILSCIAIIFMARKSDAQSFISVEDFWGGLLIGFLVGYTGTSFFQQLTGFSPNSEETPSRTIIVPEIP
ncbi:MAG: hypothetical protein F6J97_20005 [Leptolyngbya sp. SIO4C1]|nr:hypothetical protein [Leptolyngbya sp. SIO4C1]